MNKGGNLPLGSVCNLNRKTIPSDIQTWVMLMQLWGFQDAKQPHIKLRESRMKAKENINLCLEKMTEIQQELHRLGFKELDSHIADISEILRVVEKNFLKTFNNGDNNSFDKPSVYQIGHLVDVRVGHIEKFKFYEEFQVEYHLRKAGFLEKLKQFNKKRNSSSVSKEEKEEKAVSAQLKNTRKDLIDYN